MLEAGKQAQLDLDFLDAAWKGNLPEVRKLLAEGANVNAQSTRGMPALMWATSTQHADICRFLLENGADVNAKDGNDWTALHWAASYGDTETCILLLSKGADMHVRCSTQKTAFDFAEFFVFQHENPSTALFLKFFEQSGSIFGKEAAARFAIRFKECTSPA